MRFWSRSVAISAPADKSEPTVDLDRKFVVNLKEILALKEEKRSLDAQVKALETRIKSLYAPIVEEMGTACKGTCEQGGECFKVSYNPLYQGRNIERSFICSTSSVS